jgi:hypothetical protein
MTAISGIFFAVHNRAPPGVSEQEQTMTNAMAAFGVAVCGTSLVCYVLMTRAENRRANRGSSRGSASPDGSINAGGDGISDGANPVIRALQTIPAGVTAAAAAIAGEAATGVGEAINTCAFAGREPAF